MCFIKEQNFNILWNVLNGFICIQRPKRFQRTHVDYVLEIICKCLPINMWITRVFFFLFLLQDRLV